MEPSCSSAAIRTRSTSRRWEGGCPSSRWIRRARGEGHRRDVGVAVLVRRGRRGRRDHPRRNVEAFEQWGLLPRMLVGAETPGPHGRGLGSHVRVPRLHGAGRRHRTVRPRSHGDIAVAQASAHTGVPAMFSTLMEDPLEDVVPHAGDVPSFFQLYTPKNRDLAESFVKRAEAAGTGNHRQPRHLGPGCAPARPEHRQLSAAA
ncbi:hypothetical protein GS440_25800, partial [Rhodococcus hoagii]|nr:hypothetical protein [Prescottella equi]